MTTYQTWGNAEIRDGLTYESAKLIALGQLMTNLRREHGVQEIAPRTPGGAMNWVRYAGPRDDVHALLKAERERITYHRWVHGGRTYVQAVYTWEESDA